VTLSPSKPSTTNPSPVNLNFGELKGKEIIMHLCVEKPTEVERVAATTTLILNQLNEWYVKQKRKVISKTQMHWISKQTGLSGPQILSWLSERKRNPKEAKRS